MADDRGRDRALKSLDGLSLGDAFGECFLRPTAHWPAELLAMGDEVPLPLPEAPWEWTDDTAMAIELVRHLQAHGGVEPDALARRFAAAYVADPRRGYGPSIQKLLRDVHARRPWREAASEPFGGSGSQGNGSAMRVAPLGAWYADRLETPQLILDEAERSAIVTHPHHEGIAGAQAIALAAALAWARTPCDFALSVWDLLLSQLPESLVRGAVHQAARLSDRADPEGVAAVLGNGSRVLCTDTVPICLWLAARFGDDFEQAMLQTVAIGGDIDTNCAIVGGIVALLEGVTLPHDWRLRRVHMPLLEQA